MKIFLAPGHGGHDSGAVGLNGLRESDVTLDLAKGLSVLLHAAGHAVTMTRTTDVYVSPDEQGRLANVAQADVVIAIHCNAAANRDAQGIEVWTTPGQTKADPLAEAVLVEMGRAFPHANLRRDTSDGDGDKEERFAVLRIPHAPAILVETGFISHPDTEAEMRTSAWRRQAELAMFRGVQAWIKEHAA